MSSTENHVHFSIDILMQTLVLGEVVKQIWAGQIHSKTSFDYTKL